MTRELDLKTYSSSSEKFNQRGGDVAVAAQNNTQESQQRQINEPCNDPFVLINKICFSF